MPTLRIHKGNEHLPHFITLTVIEWIDIFTKPQYFQILEKTFIFCQKEWNLKIFAFVFMTNHIHFIVRSDNKNLSEVLSSFKRQTTNEIKKLIKEDNRKYILRLINTSFSKKSSNNFHVWQNRNWPEPMKSQNRLIQKMNYIHNNPVKKRYVDYPEQWKYSSAGFFNENANYECNINISSIYD